jgi:hypothetical protein
MPSNRCSICNIKVGMEYFECSCDPSKMFCGEHRFPSTHNCSKDCKKEYSKKLKKDNPVIKREKVTSI